MSDNDNVEMPPFGRVRSTLSSVGRDPAVNAVRGVYIGSSFSIRVKRAAEEGLILGVKYALVILILAAVFGLGIQDYLKVRQAAILGERSYAWILAGVNAKKLPDDWSRPNMLGALPTPLPVPFATPLPEK